MFPGSPRLTEGAGPSFTLLSLSALLGKHLQCSLQLPRGELKASSSGRAALLTSCVCPQVWDCRTGTLMHSSAVLTGNWPLRLFCPWPRVCALLRRLCSPEASVLWALAVRPPTPHSLSQRLSRGSSDVGRGTVTCRPSAQESSQLYSLFLLPVQKLFQNSWN